MNGPWGSAAPGGLSPDETRALLARAQKGDREARDRLVEANLRLVASVAARFQGRGAEFDDLFQIGCVGLMKAIDRFDLSYEVRFSTYAVPVIIGEIRQRLREDRAVRVGRAVHELGARVAVSRDRLAQKLSRAPTPAEIAADLGVGSEEVVAALDAFQAVASLEAGSGGEDGEQPPLKERIAASGPADELLETAALRAAMMRLADWERRLVALRYFLDLSQAETARRLGVSQAHVSRTERRILEQFRRWLE
ncbi:MAG: SigB/SigF/SigG family RNA polymerase sigma factor [Firmicutes bacterium]|nr:SigB/SigF/SigG family RNA polymerase sigma factor [Bacillota bacterium]